MLNRWLAVSELIKHQYALGQPKTQKWVTSVKKIASMYSYYSRMFCNQEQVMIAWVELFIFAGVLKEFNYQYFINLTWPTFTAASIVQFAVVIMLEKTRFQGIKVYFCLKNAKTRTKGISIHDRQYQVHQMHQIKLLSSNLITYIKLNHLHQV